MITLAVADLPDRARIAGAPTRTREDPLDGNAGLPSPAPWVRASGRSSRAPATTVDAPRHTRLARPASAGKDERSTHFSARQFGPNHTMSDFDTARALFFDGLDALDRRDFPTAETQFRATVALLPRSLPALLNLALAQWEQKRFAECRATATLAIGIDAHNIEAHAYVANCLVREGDRTAARAVCAELVQLDPKTADDHTAIGNAFTRLGHHREALASYDRAIALDPRHAAAHANRGNALDRLGRPDDALAAFDRAQALDPGLPESWIGRGNALSRLRRFGDALASYARAIALDPPSADARLGRAFAHYLLGDSEAFEADVRTALARVPDDVRARWALALGRIPMVRTSDDDLDAGRADLAQELDTLTTWLAVERDGEQEAVGAVTPFYLAYQERPNRELLEMHGTLACRVMSRWQDRRPIAPPRDSPRTGVVEVGIVSAHIYGQSVWEAILKGWVGGLDRDRIRLHLFNVGHHHDAETAWARNNVASFEDGPRGLAEWVDAIVSKRLDILVYPEIGMDPVTLRLASLRLAPTQVATWGHPETTGLPSIDWFLSAEAFEPPDAQTHYSERLLVLPNLGCCCAPSRVTSIAPDPAVFGLRSDLPLLLCPGAPFKYAPEHDEVLVAIARALGACRMVFFEFHARALSDRLRHRLTARFAREGLRFEDYGMFVPWQAAPAFFGLMEKADLLLDTIGFSGFNTALQAAQCGLPIVGWEGRFLRGRLASGVLHRMGLSDLVATTPEAYVALAARLARDSAYRQDCRSRIAARRDVLFGDTAPLRALEQFFSRVAERPQG
ncbi:MULTISPECIES: glycosyltransferase family 41 protein [Rhodoplanes]|nr:glycosyltransferase family 41 protein [Rhodoplanes serenus]